jgi:hypothetical protein
MAMYELLDASYGPSGAAKIAGGLVDAARSNGSIHFEGKGCYRAGAAVCVFEQLLLIGDVNVSISVGA